MEEEFRNVKKIDAYKIIGKIGQGDYGIVFLVEKNNVKYALKISSKETIDYEYKINNVFEKNKPMCIPNVYEKGKYKKYYYLVMEYVEGYTMERFFYLCSKKNITINEECVIKIIYHIIKCVDYLHSKDIIHMDLNMGNIIFNKSQLKIIDFGVSCYLKHIDDEISCFSERNEFMVEDENFYIKIDLNRINEFILYITRFMKNSDKDNIKSLKMNIDSNIEKNSETQKLLKVLENKYPYLKK